MRKFLSVLLLSLIAQEAWAANWVQVGGGDRITAYIDTTSIQRHGNVLQYWEKQVFTTPERDSVPPYKSMTYLLAQFRTNCETMENAEDYEYAYYTDGTNIGGPSPNIFAPIAPDSIAEGLAHFVCRHNIRPHLRKSKARYF